MTVAANYVRLAPITLERWRSNPEILDAICAQQLPDAEHLDLDRAWDGLAWLLSESKRKQKSAALEDDESVAAPPAPDLAWNIIEGVTSTEEPRLNFGYGAARIIDPPTVLQGSKLLDSVIQHDLRSAFDPDIMDEQEIQPGIWRRQGKTALEEYLMPYFERLRAFLRRARSAQQPVVVFFG